MRAASKLGGGCEVTAISEPTHSKLRLVSQLMLPRVASEKEFSCRIPDDVHFLTRAAFARGC